MLSLSRGMQTGVDGIDYEIIVVDNGSNPPVQAQADTSIRVIRIDPAPPSPAHAVNVGLRSSNADLIGIMIDGARLASPGLIQHAVLASRLSPRPIISTLAFHLGPDRQNLSMRNGYGREAEDELLASVRWEEDGYRLFSISTLAGSSKDGWFLPIMESNALFMTRSLWDELCGYDDRFESPGGGVVNLDTFERAWSLPETVYVVLLGEGTFHQFHDGIATNSLDPPLDRWWAEYRAIRGRPMRRLDRDPLYLGRVRPEVLPGLADSVRRALEAVDRGGPPVKS